MSVQRKSILFAVSFVVLTGWGLQAQTFFPRRPMDDPTKNDTVRSIASYFTPAAETEKTPDADGFIQRWLLLEPISKPNRSNTVFTDSYLNKAFDTLYFRHQFTGLPQDGEKVNVGEQELTWHALDSRNFNV